MEFCPTCSNLLQYELPHMGRPARFFCPTCPYVCYMEGNVKIKRKERLVKKEIDPIFSDDKERWNITSASCPACFHDKAGYYQVQIRSADEPMTTFYCCVNCETTWTGD